MGSGSDFTAFQDFAGIPSLDIGFDSDIHSPVYHYHSNYDSFHWMEKYGDPGFVYHRTMAQVLGLITAQLAHLPVISFGAKDYAKALNGYVGKVENKLQTLLSPNKVELSSMSQNEDAIFEMRASHRNTSTLTPTLSKDSSADALVFKKSLKRLYKAIHKLKYRAAKLDDDAEDLRLRLADGIPWWNLPAKLKLFHEIRRVNTKYKYLERSFLYEEGLDGRPWFKHVVFAPGLWTGYAGGKFRCVLEIL